MHLLLLQSTFVQITVKVSAVDPLECFTLSDTVPRLRVMF